MRSICDKSCSIALLGKDVLLFFSGQDVGYVSYSKTTVRIEQ